MRGPGWPVARAGLRVGLLGGSFDPAHEGHAHITRAALRRLGLDRLWWLVSPGNPLKSNGPAPLEQRLTQAGRVMQHPRVEITDLERRLGTRFTADTLKALQRHYPGVRFVWLMGADNLASMHLWEDWQDIMARVPVAVLARPGDRLSARLSPAARAYRRFFISPNGAHGLARRAPPAWTFLNVPMRDDSSSALRESGVW